MVEPLHPTAHQFGTDVERIEMPFREFLKSLKEKEGPHHYLTTQYANEEDAETMFPAPTDSLRDDFPEVPRIMGNLVLQQVNLWLGKSKDGSSSGLHHDFHDNLYCLLQGRKRFVLFPPKEVHNLYPYGTLDTLHPNGLISYADAPVRADGLSRRAACKARVRALEAKLDALGNSTQDGKGKARESKEMARQREKLMKEHDRALDALAQATLEDEGGRGVEDEVDDFDALMGGLEEQLEDEGFGEGEAGPSGLADGGSDEDDEGGDRGESEEEEDESEEESGEEEGPALGGGDEDEHSEPSSFSRIPTAHLHKHLSLPTTAVLPPSFDPAAFPHFAKAGQPLVVELSAGEMLYLPASWWHEVTSSSGPDASGDGVHMAFNYWFYPPDAPASFERPYADTLVWAHLRAQAAASAAEEWAGFAEDDGSAGKRKPDRAEGGQLPAKKLKMRR
ncbi:Clavaminate synthase-like protein [Obba rivulosa]|uniref:Clavaminate synthase-like protein n=1 Tax=Obba rivulosa TaxID=1052685 RepID=A0A8E2ART3_9APHY|nr:Clavaminate synthase-like protein [Obba rivulosa]